jgi:hypothetical protein
MLLIFTETFLGLLDVLTLLSIVWYSKEHNVSKTWSVSVLRWGGGRQLLCWFRYKDLTSFTRSQSQSYVTTDGLSWNKATAWGLRPDFYYCETVGVSWCGRISLTRGQVCRLQLLLALANAVIFGSDYRRTRDHILLSQIRDFLFRRLLRLAGLRWRYSNPPPHGNLDNQFIIYI